ncbi:unnamed protein product [Nezara viridula]|uniref:Uncharacterized protein n=1 Tax=Nezara viridula TaxID=85310 RepID=A0A9P0EGF2_NEZVI|nr:unnamed protein product [Nezara viridula]
MFMISIFKSCDICTFIQFNFKVSAPYQRE